MLNQIVLVGRLINDPIKDDKLEVVAEKVTFLSSSRKGEE